MALQGDRAEPGRGEWCSLGAGEAYLPTGILKLARYAEAAVLPVTTRYLDDRRLHVQIDAPLASDGDIGELRESLHECLADSIRRDPEQWLMMVPMMRPRQERRAECNQYSGSSTATT